MLVGVLALTMLSTVAMAGEATVKDMQDTIQELKARLATLEQEVGKQKVNKTEQAETLKLIKEKQADAASRPVLPKWLDDLKFSGDLRLRYQGECFSGRNTKNRNRARFRLRFGVKKTWLDDQMEVGFRLASGSSDDPTSTNQTFDDHFQPNQMKEHTHA